MSISIFVLMFSDDCGCTWQPVKEANIFYRKMATCERNAVKRNELHATGRVARQLRNRIFRAAEYREVTD